MSTMNARLNFCVLMFAQLFMLNIQAQTTDTYTVPGTYTWTVPPCVTSITVQVWAGGGGGGACWSRFNNTCSQPGCQGAELCVAGGGGGGGGFVTRTYTVVPGQVYNITVGSGGAGGLAVAANNGASPGSAGGNSIFSGPATAGPGALTAFGGNGGGAANRLNTDAINSMNIHEGANGTGGSGGSGSGGTTTFTGGNGATGSHSGSNPDRSGAGGGGAGTANAGGNATGVTTGGTGGATGGGNGANGQTINTYFGYQFKPGLTGFVIGGGGGGGLVHNRIQNSGNSSTQCAHRYQAGGAGERGEVRIIYTAPSVTPTFDQVSDICSGDPLGPLPATSLNGISGTWSPAVDNTSTTTYTFTPDPSECATTASMTIAVNASPIISAEPQDIAICSNGSGSLSVVASSGPYQWQYFDGTTWNNVADGTPAGFSYTGGTSATLDVTGSSALCGDNEYRVIVGSSACQVITPSAFVSVIKATRQAPTGPQCSGTSLNFDACPAGAVYSWDVIPPSGTTASPTTGSGQTFSFIPQNTTGANQIFTVNASVTYLGLTCTQTFTPTIVANADAGADGTLTICQGNTVTAADLFNALSGTPDAGGTWSPALAGAGTYTYTVAATAPCATDANAQVVVTEIAAPDAGTDGTLTICQGSTVTSAELFNALTGTPDAGGTWSPVLAGAGTYTYTYTVTVAGCTDATASVTVSEQLQPNAGTNGTLSVCQGTVPTDAELFAALSGTPDPGGTWSSVGLVYTYTVAATAPCATDATSTVTVTEQTQPNAGTNGTLDICAGTTVTAADLFNALTGTPDAGGTWSPALAGAGTYTYTVTATAPCATDATSQVVVSEIAAPDAGTDGTLTICQGSTVTSAELFNALSGTPDAGGTWSPALAGAGTYTYTVTVAGCTDATASVTVSEQLQPNAGTNGTLTVCQGTVPTDAELFAALSGTPDPGGTWSSVGLVYTYTVAATAPCAADATSTVTVTEQTQPNAGTNGTLDICAGTTVTAADLFNALTGTPDVGGTWSPALAGAGTYTYTVTATAPCATDATAQVILTISPCEVVIPTGFTPSGDGVNETWELYGLDETYPNNMVFIYNRWGSLIYESKQGDYASNPWDGTYEGKELPVSSFYYMIYTDPENEGEVMKGTISILKKE